MATEASLTDQAAHKEVEEMKIDDDIKDVNEEIVFQPKVLEQKEEEELKVEDPTIVEASVTEQKEYSDDSNDTLVEDVKKKEENKESVGGASDKEPNSEAAEQKENSDDLSDALVENVKVDEESKVEATEKEPESETVEQKERSVDSSDAVVEDVKKEEENREPEGVATEREPESEAVEQKENLNDSSDAVVEDVKKEENKEPEGVATETEPDSEAEVVEDVKEEEENKEPEGVATEKERGSEAAVETTESSDASLIQESAAESAKDPEVSDAEVKTADYLPSALEIEDKEVETPGIPVLEEQGVAILEAAEATIAEKISPDVVASSEPSKEETSLDQISGLVATAADSSDTTVDTDQVNEDKDVGAVVTEDPDLLTSDNPNAEDGIKEPVKEESASGEAEALKLLSEGHEKEEKVTLEKEPIVSDALSAETATEVAEKSGSLEETSKDVEAPLVAEVASEGVKDVTEDDKTTLVETSRDLDVDSTVKEAELEPNAAEATETIIDKSVNKESEEKKDEKTEDAKDDDQTKTVGEGQEAEVPVKSSQRQSNSIMSKVKHSIVKVKKAIIGKSSSSKNMSPEGKDDTKAK